MPTRKPALSKEPVIPFDEASWLLSKFSTEADLSQKESQTLLLWLEAMPRSTANPDCLELKTTQRLFANFVKCLTTGDPLALTAHLGFRSPPPDVIKFVESQHYLGLGASIWPGVKDNLVRIFDTKDPKFEIVLTGSIGGGKSTTSQLAIAYILCQLGHLHNPLFEFGLMPGTSIVLLLQSLEFNKVKKLLFDPLYKHVARSPWFGQYFPKNSDFKTELRFFDDQILVLPTSSADTVALGLNVFAIAITEANFMPRVRNSKKLVDSNKTIYDLAQETCERSLKRIKSRFRIDDPGFFGKLIIDSSVKHPEDLTHQKNAESKTNPTILVIKKSIWQAQPHKYPPDEPTFMIEVGDNYHESRILKNRDEARNPENVLNAPLSLQKYFEADIEEALKDYAGIATGISGAFMPFKEQIEAAQAAHASLNKHESLFRYQEISFLELFGKRHPHEPVDWGLILNYKYIDKNIIDQTVPFSMRIDLSATEDATGLAIGRINGYKLVEETEQYNPQTAKYELITNTYAPVFILDGLLRIVAKHGEEIDVDLIGQLGVELKKRLNIKWGTADRAESSRAVLQRWRQNGIICEFISVDTNLRPYMETKRAIRENRLLFPYHQVCDRELKQLHKVIKNGKTYIEHPSTSEGSKDVADAMAGAIYVLHLKEDEYRINEIQKNRRQNRSRDASPTEHRNRRSQGTRNTLRKGRMRRRWV